MLGCWALARDAIKNYVIQTIGCNTNSVPIWAQNTRADGDVVLEGDIRRVRLSSPKRVGVIAGVRKVRVLHPRMVHLAVQIDAVSLVGAGDNIVHEEVLSAIIAARFWDPDTNLARSNSIWFAKAAHRIEIPRAAAIGVVWNCCTHLGFILSIVVVVQTNILDCNVDGALTIRATIVHIGAAIVRCTTFCFKSSPTTKSTVVIGANRVNALIAHIAHCHVAAQHEAYARVHHIWSVAIIHGVARNTAGCQKQRLLLPIRALGWVRHVIGIACANDGGFLRNQHLFVNLINACWECVGFDTILHPAPECALN
mmetsp:Transcript_82636/g.215298  ORF Transcript_82636/g.215298 Transcript_82636/m.215298 type:complete len:311 (-) Transcript_82636:407-1339(-)